MVGTLFAVVKNCIVRFKSALLSSLYICRIVLDASYGYH